MRLEIPYEEAEADTSSTKSEEKIRFKKVKVIRFRLKPILEKMSQRMCLSEHPFGTIRYEKTPENILRGFSAKLVFYINGGDDPGYIIYINGRFSVGNLHNRKYHALICPYLQFLLPRKREVRWYA